MKINSILSVVLVSVFTFSTAYADKPVAISKADGPNSLEIGISVGSGDVMFMRNQNNSNTVNPAFAKTSRPCPPFCVQPMQLRPGVDTIGEQEIIHYAVMMSKGEKMPDGSEIMVIDSRTPDWVAKGMIPGAVNVPWTHLSEAKGADPAELIENDDFEDDNNSRLAEAVNSLDDRSQSILQRRWLDDKKATLHQLADEYGVSAERIRQLEKNAMKKVRLLMEA